MTEENVSDLISKEALRVENEAISGYIFDWLRKRLSRNFAGLRIGVWHEEGQQCAMVVYELNARTHTAAINISDLEISLHSQTTTAWTRFLDNAVGMLRQELSRSLIQSGVVQLPTGYASNSNSISLNNGWYEATGSRPSTNFGTITYQAAAESSKNLGASVKRVGMSVQRFDEEALEAESQEAIESIKRTLAGE